MTTNDAQVVQVAREAIARYFDAIPSGSNDAKLVRSGEVDGWGSVQGAILGARAMQSAMSAHAGGGEAIGVVEAHGGIRWFNPPVRTGTRLYTHPTPTEVKAAPGEVDLDRACEIAEQVWLSGDERSDARLKFRDAIKAALAALDLATPQEGAAGPSFMQNSHRTPAAPDAADYNEQPLQYNPGAKDNTEVQTAPAAASDGLVGRAERILEHSGCGYGVQIEQITVRLERGDKVYLVREDTNSRAALAKPEGRADG